LLGKSLDAMCRLVFPALALAVCFAAAPLHAQCPGHELPAGSVLVTQNSGAFTAPGNGKFAYTPFPIDLTQFPSGGTLMIVATLGNGQGKASFLLWLAEAVITADGTPSDSLRMSADPNVGEVAPGGCVAMTYHFVQPQNVVLGVTGSWFQSVGAANTVDFTAYVQPTGGRIAPAASAGTNSPVTSTLIQSVWIRNAPEVPDTGGHSILGGILRGNLSAVEPNLVICVTPAGTSGGRRTCTDICPPGHECQKDLRVQLNGTNPSVHVEVLDDDKQGKIQQLGVFDESDARKCLPDQPCMENTPTGTPMSVSFGFGGPEGCAVPTSASGLGSTQVTPAAAVSGTVPAAASTPATATAPNSTTTNSSLQATLAQAFAANSVSGKLPTATTASAAQLTPTSGAASAQAAAPLELGQPGMRPCCLLWQTTAEKGGPLDPSNLGPHFYGDNPSDLSGYVYTENAGIADLGHIRDNADMTRALYFYLLNKTYLFNPPAGSVVVLTPPKTQDEMLDLAGAIAYVDSVAHELDTWEQWFSIATMITQRSFTAGFAQDWSAFSPEDLPSNIVGIEVAQRAIRDAGCAVQSDADFNVSVREEIDSMMNELGAQDVDKTALVLEQINGSWYKESYTTTDWLLRRNFDGSPWFARTPQEPAPAVPTWLNPARFQASFSKFSYVMTQAVRGSAVSPLGITRLNFNGVLAVASNGGNAQPTTCAKVAPAAQTVYAVMSAGKPVAGLFACAEDKTGPPLTLTTMQNATYAIENAWLASHPGGDQCGFDPKAVLASVTTEERALMTIGVLPMPACQ
jgi:hypothetical protein